MYWLQNLLLLSLSAVGRLLPRHWWLACGRGLGSLAFAVDRRHRNRTIRNISAAYGAELTPAQQQRLARGAFRHLGVLLFEGLALPWRSQQQIEALVELEGVEHYRAAEALGRGVIIITGHFGNWEIHAIRHGYTLGPAYVVGRAPDNPYFKRWLERLRAMSGNQVIYKEGALRQMRRVFRKGGTVAFLIDQNIRKGDRVFVDFFGRKAATTRLPAWFSLKYGTPLVPVFCIPTDDGRYRAAYQPAIIASQQSGLSTDEILLQVTQQCTSVLEQHIRRDPEYWMWMQRRWVSRPPEEMEIPTADHVQETEHEQNTDTGSPAGAVERLRQHRTGKPMD